jgi:hypothetical protein
MERMAGSIAGAVRQALAGRAAQQDARIADLEQRLAGLEASTACYRGLHALSAPYPRGAMVTRGGSLWIAEQPTEATPGEPGSGWRLAVKSSAR